MAPQFDNNTRTTEMHTEKLIQQGRKATIESLMADLDNGDTSSLAFATEEQALELADLRGDSDVYAWWDMEQEEMRILVADAMAEFGL